MATDKLIVTSKSALRTKYGGRSARIDTAIKRLIAADRKAGIRSLRIDLDAMEPRLKQADPASAAAERLTKNSIDAVWRRYAPDYLLILGANDVVAMQSLKNPLNVDLDPANDDEDLLVPSDLPYACEQGYSDDPARFVGPTRVVGRLPDLPGASEPSYLLRLLSIAANATSRPRTDYASYFGLSAYVWRKSTALSLENLFGESAAMRVSPPSGPQWSSPALAPRIHFINCHGDRASPRFFGQRNDSYPSAHHSPRLPGKISEGAVIAAECCYGAQLYDPRQAQAPRDRGDAGISAVYLQEGAYGFFGSTTIAYGPSEGNGQADLICQHFLRAVRDGASLGRAALEARHRFAAHMSHLDPADLKTLMQFYLLGDPSIHPVEAPAHALTRSPVFRRALRKLPATAGSRSFRRERARRTGTNLSRSLGAARPMPRAAVPLGIKRILMDIARESGLANSSAITPYRVEIGTRPSPGLAQRRIYVLSGSVPARDRDGCRVVSVIATAEAGQLVHLRRVHSR